MCHHSLCMIAWLFWRFVFLWVNQWRCHLSWTLYLHICDVHLASCLAKTNYVQIRVRAFLALPYTYGPCHSSVRNPWEFGRFDERLSLDCCYQWPKPVISEAGYPLPCRRSERIFNWGCVQEHLLLVSRVSQKSDHYIIRLVLINVRSLTNKTFILNDFFKLVSGFSVVDGNVE